MTHRDDAPNDLEPTVDASVRERADALVMQMTPEEKAGQLTQYFYFSGMHEEVSPDGSGTSSAHPVDEALRRGEVGSLLFVTDPAEINRLQRMAVEETRLGIPLLFGLDVIHGFRTVFPVPIAMAASWDPDVIERAQSIAAREAHAVGVRWTFAPMIDIARDPRWGRMIEGAGEDPYLASAVAVAQVKGFQGESIGSPERIISGPKHFAGYGASLGGRDYDEVNLSDNELWNVYLPPFEAAVRAGCGNIMGAYMDLNGIPASGNRWLLTSILRDTWGFDGFVVSDANAVRSLETQHFARDLPEAAVRALYAGVDMEMALSDAAYTRLPGALAEGQIEGDVLDASVRRILEAKIRLGLFENPYVDTSRTENILNEPRHRAEARVAAERSAVLLKNQEQFLPLDRTKRQSLAVIGPLADSQRETVGPWVFDFNLDETVTVLDGISQKVDDAATVTYAPGIRRAHRTHPSMFDMFPGGAPDRQPDFDDEAEFERAVTTAQNADIAVIVLGEWQNMIGENASRASLDLPGRQLELLKAVVDTGTPVILLLMNGRPLDIRWAIDRVPAILDIWYPGSQGGHAVANLLFGDTVPGGKLPFTWPRSVGQVPMIYAHTTSHQPEKQDQRYWDEGSTPLFPFGFGLSYSSFRYSNLKTDQPGIRAGETVHVSVDVTNTGDRRAEEVAQLYIHQRYGNASRPVRELKGFQRILLDAGKSQTLQFTLGPEELRYWNAAKRDWMIDESTFDVWVGGDSTATLSTTFDIIAG